MTEERIFKVSKASWQADSTIPYKYMTVNAEKLSNLFTNWVVEGAKSLDVGTALKVEINGEEYWSIERIN